MVSIGAFGSKADGGGGVEQAGEIAGDQAAQGVGQVAGGVAEVTGQDRRRRGSSCPGVLRTAVDVAEQRRPGPGGRRG